MAVYDIPREPDFLDIDLSFTKNRRSRDVNALSGIDVITNAVKNLVNTNFYEKPFRPAIGSNVRKLLFEPVNHLTSTFLQNAIAEVIINYEPRVTLLDVVVKPMPDNNRYDITVVFNVKNFSKTVEINSYLTRVR
jgi:phage baseplate assembly protein W